MNQFKLSARRKIPHRARAPRRSPRAAAARAPDRSAGLLKRDRWDRGSSPFPAKVERQIFALPNRRLPGPTIDQPSGANVLGNDLAQKIFADRVQVTVVEPTQSIIAVEELRRRCSNGLGQRNRILDRIPPVPHMQPTALEFIPTHWCAS